MLAVGGATGCKELAKALKQPEPVAVVAIVDSSRSFQPWAESAQQLMMNINEHMEPQIDQLHLFRVGAEETWLYSGMRPAPMKLKQQFGAYVYVNEHEYGTAYGTALLRGAKEATRIAKQTNPACKRVAIVVLGDGADERTQLARSANLNWPHLEALC